MGSTKLWPYNITMGMGYICTLKGKTIVAVYVLQPYPLIIEMTRNTNNRHKRGYKIDKI